MTNTGERAGSEVVQVYVQPPEGDDARPVRHLGAFARVDLAPGATERVRLELPVRVFSSWLDGRLDGPARRLRLVGGPLQPRPHRRRHRPRLIRPYTPSVDQASTVDGVEAGGLRAAFVRLNGREPKKPLWADSGDGWADSTIVCRVGVDQRLLLAGVAAPEDEHDRLVLGRHPPDHLVGEQLPAVALV